MKYCYILLLLLFTLPVLEAQSVASSCEANDSLKQYYQFNATKLAIRELYNNGSPDTVSVVVEKSYTDEVLKSLVAVHQAYGLVARDEVIDFYNIHALEAPVTNSFFIYVDTSYEWVEQWLNSEVLTGNTHIDCRVDSFELFISKTPEMVYDEQADVHLLKVNLQTEFHLNLKPLLGEFLNIDGVIYAEQDFYQGEVDKDIQYEYNAVESYTDLTYRYGWDDCDNGCVNEHFWKFRVSHSDCSVAFLSDGGAPLLTNNPTQISQIAAYPNPTSDLVSVKLVGPANVDFLFRLHDSFGRLIQSKDLGFHNGLINLQIDLSPLPIGVYFITFSQDDQVLTKRVIKK